MCVEHRGEASTGGLGKPATAGLSLTAFEGCEGWLIFQSKAVVWREGLQHCSTTSQALLRNTYSVNESIVLTSTDRAAESTEAISTAVPAICREKQSIITICAQLCQS